MSRNSARPSADAIAQLSQSLHGIELSKERAQAIASELEDLNGAAWNGAEMLPYDAEPFPFDAVLRSLKRRAQP